MTYGRVSFLIELLLMAMYAYEGWIIMLISALLFALEHAIFGYLMFMAYLMNHAIFVSCTLRASDIDKRKTFFCVLETQKPLFQFFG